MKIMYCKKYRNYVSQFHCEAFNEGQDCTYYTEERWRSIKDLLIDPKRPVWDVGKIIRPFGCKIMELREAGPAKRRRRGARA
jgi:hypothetical protein